MRLMNQLKRFLARLPHPVRWVLTMLIGIVLLVLGLIMLVTPGPGLLFLFLGISVLALEIEWARELNKQGVQGLEILLNKLRAFFKKK
ncbi:MAG: PGPGW domain-containing protein [Actinomycetes bacterium]